MVLKKLACIQKVTGLREDGQGALYSLKLGDIFYSEPENKRSDQVEQRSDRVQVVPGGGSLRSEA